MNFGRNRFKARLYSGDTMLGIWCSLASVNATELMANSGIDWLMIDTEHSPLHIEAVLPFLQATESLPASRLVRIADHNPILIKKALDIGARTLMCPMVQSAEDAEAIVKATRYPPEGIRGVSARIRANDYGQRPHYAQEAKDEICVIVQVETVSALKKIEEISQVEGVDAVFIGPSDLAASAGFIGQLDHPDLQTMIQNAIRALQKIQIPAGILATNTETARKYVEMGYQFVSVTSDSAILASGAQNAVFNIDNT